MKRKVRHIRGLSKPKPIIEQQLAGLPRSYNREQLDSMPPFALRKTYDMWHLRPIRGIANRNHMINDILRVQNLDSYTESQLKELPRQALIHLCEARGCVSDATKWTREQQIYWIISMQKLVRHET